MAYEKLFEKGKIGHLTIRNRAVLSPMGTDYADHEGKATDRLICYYEERAKGGIGLIINEYMGVDDVDSIPSVYNFRMAQDYHIAECERLTDAIHRHGAKIFAQLHHAGATSKPALTGRQNLAPSDVPMVPGGAAPKAMTLEDIRRIQDKFVQAAIRCKKAGYDGIELHGAHSYLLAQFASRYYNRRTDDYGGSLENRLRFISEIIRDIRSALGSFPISVRICGDEMTEVEGFLTLEEGLEIGRYLESQGINALNISNGSSMNANANCDPYSYQPGWKKHVAKAFKEALTIPIIATNTIKNPDFAEKLLEEGVCDFVALGRATLADPEFMKKTKENRQDEIRQCIGCMHCRERLLANAMPVACAINPRTGREYVYPAYVENGNGRIVAVVGGGPAGMEAAIVLARRKFRVILFEKESSLGGTLQIADKPPFKHSLTDFVQTLQRQMALLGVEVRLNTEASVPLLKQLKPEAVVVACGSDPLILPIPGINPAAVQNGQDPNILLAEEVILGNAQARGDVAIIGSGLTGLETAEILGEKGQSITMVEMMSSPGPGIFSVILQDSLSRLKKFDITWLTGHKLMAVEESSAQEHSVDSETADKGQPLQGDASGRKRLILTKMEDQSQVELEVDTVVLAMGVRPRAEVVEEFEKVFDKVIAVGDAVKGGSISSAMKIAFDMAWGLGD